MQPAIDRLDTISSDSDLEDDNGGIRCICLQDECKDKKGGEMATTTGG